MELNVFLDYVYEGREFEFSLDSIPYFLYYDLENIDGKETQIMHLSNCKIKKEIFKGTVDELLNFNFGKNITFNNSIGNLLHVRARFFRQPFWTISTDKTEGNPFFAK